MYGFIFFGMNQRERVFGIVLNRPWQIMQGTWKLQDETVNLSSREVRLMRNHGTVASGSPVGPFVPAETPRVGLLAV